MKRSNTAANAFSLYAEDYDRWFDDHKGRTLFATEVMAIRLLMKALSPPFLEVGVGSGRFARELGIEFGIDPSPRLLQMALRRGIKVSKAPGEALPFKDESFGAVFILFTLCFVAKPDVVVTEAVRVLKPGGGLIIGIINKDSPWGQWYMQKKALNHPIYKYANFYSINEVEKMLWNAGLKVVSYSSTLCQLPTEDPYEEIASQERRQDAGFVCILGKNNSEMSFFSSPVLEE